MTKGADMTVTAQRAAAVSATRATRATNRYAVVCCWEDRRWATEGSEAIVLEAEDSNAALLRAHALRPDLWEQRPHLYRKTAVYPVHTISGASQ